MISQERNEGSFENSSRNSGDNTASASIGLGSLTLRDITNINAPTDAKNSGSMPTEIVFNDIPGYSNHDKSTTQNDRSATTTDGGVLVASARGNAALGETKEIYRNALQTMVNAGHHLPGGDFNSGYGNVLQNSGMSSKTWVCAEQAEFLAHALKHDPNLQDSKIYLIHTPNYEHLFVGVKDPDGKMIYMDPWREKGPSRTSPNEIEGMVEVSR